MAAAAAAAQRLQLLQRLGHVRALRNVLVRYCSSSRPKEGGAPPERHGSREMAANILPQKTTVTILNSEVTDLLVIDKYSPTGFLLNTGIRILGSMIIFPRGVLSWRISSHTQVTVDSLSLFPLLEPRLDLLILGVGDEGNTVNPDVLRQLKSCGVTVEALPTAVACATFNYLNMERRYVAAALIPPLNMPPDDPDTLPLRLDAPPPDLTRLPDTSGISIGEMERQHKERRRRREILDRVDTAPLQRVLGKQLRGASAADTYIDVTRRADTDTDTQPAYNGDASTGTDTTRTDTDTTRTATDATRTDTGATRTDTDSASSDSDSASTGHEPPTDSVPKKR